MRCSRAAVLGKVQATAHEPAAAAAALLALLALSFRSRSRLGLTLRREAVVVHKLLLLMMVLLALQLLFFFLLLLLLEKECALLSLAVGVPAEGREGQQRSGRGRGAAGGALGRFVARLENVGDQVFAHADGLEARGQHTGNLGLQAHGRAWAGGRADEQAGGQRHKTKHIRGRGAWVRNLSVTRQSIYFLLVP